MLLIFRCRHVIIVIFATLADYFPLTPAPAAFVASFRCRFDTRFAAFSADAFDARALCHIDAAIYAVSRHAVAADCRAYASRDGMLFSDTVFSFMLPPPFFLLMPCHATASSLIRRFAAIISFSSMLPLSCRCCFRFAAADFLSRFLLLHFLLSFALPLRRHAFCASAADAMLIF